MSIPPPPHLQPPQPPSYYDSLMMLAGVDAIDTMESLPLPPVKAPNSTRPPNKLNTTANNKDDMPKAPKTSIKEMAERSSAAASREDDIEYDDTLSAEQIAALERATLEESGADGDYAYPPPAPDGYDDQTDKINHLLLAHPDSDLSSEINKGSVNPNVQPENAALAYQNLVYGSFKPLPNHTGSPLPGAYDFVNAPPPVPHQFPQSPMNVPAPASPMTPGTPSALGHQGTPNKPARPPPATRQSTNTSSQFKSEECPICHRTFKGPKASTHKQQHVRRMHPAHYIPKRGGKKRADSPPTPNAQNELNKSLYTSLAQQATSSYQQ